MVEELAAIRPPSIRPDPARGQEAQHGREGDIVAHQRRVEVGEGLLDVGQLGINDQRGQADQNPRPGPQT